MQKVAFSLRSMVEVACQSRQQMVKTHYSVKWETGYYTCKTPVHFNSQLGGRSSMRMREYIILPLASVSHYVEDRVFFYVRYV